MLSPEALRHVFEPSPLSTVLYDTAGHVLWVNPAFERLFGLTLNDVPPTYSLLTDPQLTGAGFFPTIQRAFAGESVVLPPVHYDPATYGGPSRAFWSQAVMFPLRDGTGLLCGVALMHTDLTERMEAEEAHRKSEERLRIAMEVGRMGAWEWDIVGQRVHWSEELQRIHGLVPGTFGGTFEEYQADIHPDDRERVLGQIPKTFAGAEHHLKYRIIRPSDGAVRWLEARGELFRDAEGNPLRLLGICTDVTEREEQQQALAAALERADEANRAKAEFLASMSHELRTPLNAIGGYAQLIEMGIHGPVTDAQLESLRRLKRSQQHLLSLINDVLNFAKLEAGRVRYEIAPTPVASVIRDVESLLAPLAASKQLRCECDPCGDDLVALADAEKVQQILLNLIGNAIKFTPAGGLVRVSAVESGGRVAIMVSDTGIGIAADKQEAVFEPFMQLGRRGTSGEEGTGLGLAISRDLARAMGGDVTLESALDRGSTFTLWLPKV
jgi:PAS domain S-box-containing protein